MKVVTRIKRAKTQHIITISEAATLTVKSDITDFITTEIKIRVIYLRLLLLSARSLCKIKNAVNMQCE